MPSESAAAFTAKPLTLFVPGDQFVPLRPEGKTYVVPAVSMRLGLQLHGNELDGMKSRELWPLLLGPLWDEMLSDGVSYEVAARAGSAAYSDFIVGRAYAEHYWTTGSYPEALAATTAAIEQAVADSTPTPKASPRSRNTASASRTKTASTTRTTSRRK